VDLKSALAEPMLDAEKWKNPPIPWHAAKTQLAIQLEDRFVLS